MARQQNSLLLMRGVRQLRAAAGEEAAIRLIRSNLDVRAQMWGELMRSGDPAIHEALANILIGLGLEPEEFGRTP